MQIYKILRAAEWAALSEFATTGGSEVDMADGYIHFSTAEQVQETLDKHFAGETGLVLLAYDADKLGNNLKWEPSRGGQMFPHLYSALSLADMLWQRAIAATPEGHTLPEGVA
jgi:uncharacterized protein (DUF952 family)